jgi:hypothetical protein
LFAAISAGSFVKRELQAWNFALRLFDDVIQNSFAEFLRIADLDVPKRNCERLCIFFGSCCLSC